MVKQIELSDWSLQGPSGRAACDAMCADGICVSNVRHWVISAAFFLSAAADLPGMTSTNARYAPTA
jgi:hypothetical protein